MTASPAIDTPFPFWTPTATDPAPRTASSRLNATPVRRTSAISASSASSESIVRGVSFGSGSGPTRSRMLASSIAASSTLPMAPAW
jgi:hypothetical protein